MSDTMYARYCLVLAFCSKPVHTQRKRYINRRNALHRYCSYIYRTTYYLRSCRYDFHRFRKTIKYTVFVQYFIFSGVHRSRPGRAPLVTLSFGVTNAGDVRSKNDKTCQGLKEPSCVYTTVPEVELLWR